MTAVVVADDFSDAIAPLTTATLPSALVPIANTPLIDYILENLVQNGVARVLIFSYRCYNEILRHLEEDRVSTGKPWTRSTEIGVEVIQGAKTVKSLGEAMRDVLASNHISQNGHFIYIPFNAISTIFNYRELWDRHVARVTASPKIKLTMVCLKDAVTLRDAFDSVMSRKEKEVSGLAMEEMPSETPVTVTQFPEASAIQLGDVLQPVPLHPRHTVAYCPQEDNLVYAFTRWDTAEGNIAFSTSSMKKAMHVRSDLVSTGIFVCTVAVLNTFQRPLYLKGFEEGNDCLVRHFLDYVDVEGDCLALDVVEGAVVQPVRCVRSYVASNIAVVQRQLFPMTRESNFASELPIYTVAHYSPSVLLHTSGCNVAASSAASCVVCGAQCSVETSAYLQHSVLGDNVAVGKGSRIINSVIMSDAVIGEYTTIENSVVCQSAVICSRVLVGGFSVIGAGVRIDNHGDFTVPSASRIVLPPPGGPSDASLVGTHGKGVALECSAPAAELHVQEMFVNDPITQGSEGDDNDSGDDEAENSNAFAEAIREEVEQTVTTESRRERTSVSLSSIMLTHHKSRLDVAAKFMESLIELIDRRNMESGSPKEAARALKTVIKALTRPVLRDVVKRDQRGRKAAAEELACLAGFAAGLTCRNGSCLLREKADVVLSALYAGDDELFNKDGYSVVSYHAILFFDDCINGKATSDVITELGFDREQLEAGWRCVAGYIVKLRQA